MTIRTEPSSHDDDRAVRDDAPDTSRPARTHEVAVTEPIGISGLQRLSRELTGALAHDARQITLDFTVAGPVPVYVVGLLNRIASALDVRQGTLHLRGLSGFEAAMMLAGGLDRRVDVQVRPGELPPDRTDPSPPDPAP